MRRFFFVHVQKAAGTELRERLKRLFAPEALYPDKTDGDIVTVAPQVSAAQLLARWEVRKDEIEVVTGHFPLATAELLDADFTTLTVLREPVERTLSHLRHYRSLSPEARGKSLEAIYDETPAYVFLRDHMVKMFAMTADEVATAARENKWPVVKYIELTRDRMARAQERLANVDVLGLQDRFDEFCAVLQSEFGWQLGEPLYANRTPHTDVPDSLRARIAADNALDVEFFEYACDLYDRRGPLSGS
jgi:Sulfotransferase family